jgi:hypothetical protein
MAGAAIPTICVGADVWAAAIVDQTFILIFTAGEAGPASRAVTDSREDAAATVLTSTSTFGTHVGHRFRLLKLFDYSGVKHNRQ